METPQRDIVVGGVVAVGLGAGVVVNLQVGGSALGGIVLEGKPH
jgi:hypothetical protein